MSTVPRGKLADNARQGQCHFWGMERGRCKFLEVDDMFYAGIEKEAGKLATHLLKGIETGRSTLKGMESQNIFEGLKVDNTFFE